MTASPTTGTETNPVDLKKVLQGAPIAAMPQSAIRILELSKDSNKGPADYAVIIEADPGLAGQVLKFVNSSYFGFSREISNVKLAINLVGVRTIRNFTLWTAVFSLVPNPKCGSFDLKRLWQDSLRRGLFARRLCQVMGKQDGEEAFIAALLQDMAVPMLAKEKPQQYQQWFQEREASKARLSVLESAAFGWSHAEVGAALANHWKLPDTLSNLIGQHTDLDRALNSSDDTTAAVALSSLLPAAVDDAWHDAPRLESVYQELRPTGAIALADLLAQTDEQFAKFAPAFKMAEPAKRLADQYQESLAVAE